MISRDTDVGCTFLEHREHRADDRTRRTNFDAISVNVTRTRRKKLPKELVGAVNQMHLHTTVSFAHERPFM